jgi:hypothetical protein
VEEQFERILNLPHVGHCPDENRNLWLWRVAQACAHPMMGIRPGKPWKAEELARAELIKGRSEKGDEVRRAFQRAYTRFEHQGDMSYCAPTGKATNRKGIHSLARA